MSSIQALRNIPFGELIGGPLKSAVEAQAMAAESTVEFIERVGFVPPVNGVQQPGLRTVTFAYQKDNGEGQTQNFSLTVPLLAIVPIPFIRIDEVNIEFNAKLNDVVRTESSNQSAFGASAGFSAGKFSARASYSTTRKSSTSSSFEAEYQMNIKVKAGAAPMPEGMAKILDILEQVITEQPATAA